MNPLKTALMVGAIAGASACTRVATVAIDSVEPIGQGRLRIIAVHTEENYPLVGHESAQTIARRWSVHEAVPATAGDDMPLRELADLEGTDAQPALVVYSEAREALTLQPPTDLPERACEGLGNLMYADATQAAFPGGIASLCDGVLTVQTADAHVPDCQVDLRPIFFRDTAALLAMMPSRYPIRIGTSGGQLFAFVSFDDSLRSNDAVVREALAQLVHPAGTLVPLSTQCVAGPLRQVSLPEGFFIRSIGVESPTAFLVEKGGDDGVYLAGDDGITRLADAVAARIRERPLADRDGVILDNFSHALLEVTADTAIHARVLARLDR